MKYYSIHFGSVEQLRYVMSRVFKIFNRNGVYDVTFTKRSDYRYDFVIGDELTFICLVRVHIGFHIDGIKILGSYNVMANRYNEDPVSLYEWMMNKYMCNRYSTRVADFFIYPQIKKVIFNDPATIVFWSDGSKTVVKAQDGETYDQEKGLAMAITKKWFGNKGNYYNNIKKYI